MWVAKLVWVAFCCSNTTVVILSERCDTLTLHWERKANTGCSNGLRWCKELLSGSTMYSSLTVLTLTVVSVLPQATKSSASFSSKAMQFTKDFWPQSLPITLGRLSLIWWWTFDGLGWIIEMGKQEIMMAMMKTFHNYNRNHFEHNLRKTSTWWLMGYRREPHYARRSRQT